MPGEAHGQLAVRATPRPVLDLADADDAMPDPRATREDRVVVAAVVDVVHRLVVGGVRALIDVRFVRAARRAAHPAAPAPASAPAERGRTPHRWRRGAR